MQSIKTCHKVDVAQNKIMLMTWPTMGTTTYNVIMIMQEYNFLF